MGCGVPVQRLRRDKLLHEARKVFDTPDEALRWISAANAALDGQTPVSLCETVDGLQLALEALRGKEKGPA